jgi:hypothetical protein
MGRRDCATDRQFHKRRQFFIRSHNQTPSVAAMRVRNPDRSPVGINGSETALTPTGFPEIVCDDSTEWCGAPSSGNEGRRHASGGSLAALQPCNLYESK